MSIKSKKILSIVTYYTLFGIAILMSVLALLFVVNRGLPLWSKVLYVIWCCAVIGVLIFDIICTSTRRMKFISGLIIYVLSIVSLVVTIILYLVSASLTAGLTAVFMPIFAGTSAIIMATTIYMIATFVVGESVVEHKTALKSVKEKQN